MISAAVMAALTAAGWAAPWAATHLALAGAATVAIAAFMPHFAVTLAGTQPGLSVARLASLVLLAGGALFVVLGFTLVGSPMAVAGAAMQIAALTVVGWHTLAPTREPLARRHPVVTVAYCVALAELAAGIALGGLVALGADPVLGAWATLRATHVWLSLFGAISLTIFATLVYLAPTVLGARIRPTPGLAVGVVGMVAGPLVAAAGFALGSAVVAVAGVGVTLAGALGQMAMALDAHRRRGPFTSEHDWRRVAAGHLLAGPAWFTAAVTTVLVDLILGRPLVGWAMGALAVPMVAGWMLQELVGSWTHLAPSVTPGDAASHARQRRHLAIASRTRLLAWNGGVALLWVGLAAGIVPLAMVGGALLAAAVGVSLLALGRALVTRR